MNVVVPYVKNPMLDVVRLNLEIQGTEAEYREMTTETSYAELFIELWARQVPFILVEHDVLPWPGAIEQLANCSLGWCGFNTSLQCTKFVPFMLGECPVTPDTHWQQVDKVFWTLEDRFKFHEHSPQVVHLHQEG